MQVHPLPYFDQVSTHPTPPNPPPLRPMFASSLTEGEARRHSTVDLPVLTSLDQFIFILITLFIFFTKQTTLMRRSTVLSLPLQLVFPDMGIRKVITLEWVYRMYPYLGTEGRYTKCLYTECRYTKCHSAVRSSSPSFSFGIQQSKAIYWASCKGAGIFVRKFSVLLTPQNDFKAFQCFIA
jgi:hypothetical protein